MTTGQSIAISAISGAIVGAIGAAVADASDAHPVLKGAAVTGALYALITGAIIFGSNSTKQLPPSSGVSGWQPRFP